VVDNVETARQTWPGSAPSSGSSAAEMQDCGARNSSPLPSTPDHSPVARSMLTTNCVAPASGLRSSLARCPVGATKPASTIATAFPVPVRISSPYVANRSPSSSASGRIDASTVES